MSDEQQLDDATQEVHADNERTLARSQARSDEIEAQLAKDPSQFRVLTGDRPTGRLHLGHFLGTLENRVRLQKMGVETWILAADYQVITDRDDAGPIQERTFELVTDYLATGIDPTTATIFTHSAIPALNQLMLPFLSLVTDAELRRNPTVKAEHEATGGRPLSGLLLTYPVHQAADILFCKANLVPVGRDQLPHLEQTRVIARRFNDRYAPVFPAPDALLSASALVLGTDGHKMSKSRGNTIELGMSADETAKQFKRAVTDANRNITFDPVNRPEVANLLQIASMCSGEDPRVLADHIGDGGGAGLKKVVTEAVNTKLAPIRELRTELMRNRDYVRSILRDGNERANEVAEATMAQVREAMKMVY